MPLIITIKVVPSSGKQQCTIDRSGTIKCYLKSAPEKGKANAELINFLSKKLKLPQNAITIQAGATTRKKRLKIDANLTFEHFCQKLGIELQNQLY